jgi:hypothetical protein
METVMSFGKATIAGVAAAMVFAGTAHAATDIVTGVCNPTTMQFISEGADTSFTKSNANPSNIPQTAITFTQGGSVPGCVVVRFSAEVWTDIGAQLVLKPMIDDRFESNPKVVLFFSNASDVNARSFEFVFKGIKPGRHTLNMKWLAENNPVSIGRHITVVQYTK